MKAVLEHKPLGWQRTVAMLNRGNQGHPKRFYAGDRWETTLFTYYWAQNETDWKDTARDRLKWKRTEKQWVEWFLRPRWTAAGKIKGSDAFLYSSGKK